MVAHKIETSETYYLGFLTELHRQVMPKVYLEIGVHGGRSLNLCNPDTLAVAIDPHLWTASRPNTEWHAVTSDEYFRYSENVKFDMAFIDGLHTFDQVYRDLINVSNHMTDGGIIAIHDILPEEPSHATKNITNSIWAGDVWKLLYPLTDWSGEVRFSFVKPTGMVVLPAHKDIARFLTNRYEDDIERYSEATWEDYLKIKESLING
ncbi:class I SAM-dependent methyltransferase [Patescibacteria group bacterium]|nr:class I SAM-dependent methyltransferase [Patescibacteria group bacterium]